MKVVILAGGYGSRFGGITDFLPKPMIPVGPFPIIWHIMRTYAHYGHDEFIVCTGYKSDLIKEYFYNLKVYSSDFSIDLGDDQNASQIEFHSDDEFRPKITVAYTGQDTMTGGRIKRVEKYLDGQDFLLTYGDGLSDQNINELVKFHYSHGKKATLTAVYPPPRFGDLRFEGSKVTSFEEKQGNQGNPVNGGFYVFNNSALEYLSEDSNCVLEKSPLETLASQGELMAYTHAGFWQCMDTTRDWEYLKKSWASGIAPWKKWNDSYKD